MMKKTIIAAMTIAITSGLFAASAEAGTPWVDKREHRQAERIWHGIANGSLNARETGKLLRGQARIRAAERRYKADGVVTPRERHRLHRQLNRQNRKIWRKKHN